MDQYLELDGTVVEALPNMTFKVLLADKRVILATIAGRMRMRRRFFNKILPGDIVRVEVSVHDQTRGRIVWKGR